MIINLNPPFINDLQAKELWCWAAVASNVAFFYNSQTTWTQCAIANRALEKNFCCDKKLNAPCNQRLGLEKALEIVGHLRHQLPYQQGYLQFNEILNQLQANKPVCAYIQWGTTGNGHFVVIGAADDSQSEMLTIYDPWFDISYGPYSEVVSNYRGIGQWAYTYFTD